MAATGYGLGINIAQLVVMSMTAMPPWSLLRVVTSSPLALLNPLFCFGSGLWITTLAHAAMVWLGRKQLARKAAKAELDTLAQLSRYPGRHWPLARSTPMDASIRTCNGAR